MQPTDQIDEPLTMDIRDVRGSNNLDVGHSACKRVDSPYLNGVNSTLPDAFHNALDPQMEIVVEKPIHRVMMFMFAKGMQDNEVAEETGYSLVQVAKIRRQPWMQAQITAEIRKAGEKDVKELLAGMGPECLKGIYAIAQDPLAKQEVVLRARQDIVDRWIGKACQPVKDETKGDLSQMSDAELAKIAKGETA